MSLNFETDGLNFNSKGKPDEIATPQNIADDMSNLFDYTNCNQKIWMDIFCKTGNFLASLKKQGVDKNNIAAICQTLQSQMLVCRKLYGELLPEIEVEITVKSLETYKITRRGQVYWVSNWQDIVKNNYQDAYNIIKFVILKEMEKTMSLEFTSQDDFQINNIIMNPPYNNDMYLDFVTLAKNIATDSVVAITPAKWQAKGGAKNEQFRKNIVPHMKNIVYYPDSDDVFDIRLSGGLSYYLLDKCTHSIKETKCISTRCSSFNSDWEEQEIITIHRNLINNIVRKCSNNRIRLEEIKGQKYVGDRDSKIPYSADGDICVMQGDTCCGMIKKCNIRDSGIKDVDKYKCIMHSMLISPVTNSDGTHLGIQKPIILMPNQIPKGIYFEIFCSDSLAEVESLQSYFNCKLIRFLFYINAMSTYMDESNFDKVPDPGAFDHIFTDEELYKKYNLTDEEINIIESVIKERK